MIKSASKHVLSVIVLLFISSCIPFIFEVTSDPSGASIKVDGEERAETTPAKISIPRNKMTRTHVLEVGKEGYFSATETIRPLGGGLGSEAPRTSYHFDLTPRPSQVIEQIDPSSLKVDLANTSGFLVGVLDVKISENMPKEIQVPLTNAIISELLGLNKFKVIDRANREAILRQLASQMAACQGKDCSVAEVGKLLGVNRMVISYVNLIENKYYITITLVNVETGFVEALSESVVECKIEDLPYEVRKAARGLFK